MPVGRAHSPDRVAAASGHARSSDPGAATFGIGELSEAFGITPRALRFYETRGLLAPQRNGAERRYSNEDRARLAFVLQAKRLGFTLREIDALLAAGDCSPGILQLSRRQCTEQINLLERQKREIEAALNELRRVYSSHYLRALASGASEG